jgi:hypothetical protein
VIRVPSGDVRQHLKLTRRELGRGTGVTSFRPVSTPSPAYSFG